MHAVACCHDLLPKPDELEKMDPVLLDEGARLTSCLLATLESQRSGDLEQAATKKPAEAGFFVEAMRCGLQLLRLHEAVELGFSEAEPQV